ncbi:uncharacterized protein LOC129582305 [Paramacrobiotus metropolitanus]|uniref:uncharacterized protein LOC129582305 n=1 Tax=Paramacrobiotus metropolitanus TaxID=2943436 RepID=UPI0024459625|nr:uncharacterized protein LOC129582305 [Paramacrobiotus metropolitanus]
MLASTTYNALFKHAHQCLWKQYISLLPLTNLLNSRSPPRSMSDAGSAAKTSDAGSAAKDQPGSVRIGHLDPRDYHLPVEWGRKEGWTVRDSDVKLILAVDPRAWYAASLNNEVVSLMCAINYDPKFATVGCFITREDHREKGEGFGVAVFEAALEHTGDRVTQLFAQEDVAEKYEKKGFAKDGNSVVQYERELDDGFWRGFDAKEFTAEGVQLENINQTDLADLAAFDRKYFPASRETFLRELVKDGKISGRVAVRGGKVAGYGTIRDLEEGVWKIGPLYAETPEVAAHLFAAFLDEKKPRKLLVAVPISKNGNARKLVKRFGMKEQVEVFVMYRNGRPEGLEEAGMYAITNAQIG